MPLEKKYKECYRLLGSVIKVQRGCQVFHGTLCKVERTMRKLQNGKVSHFSSAEILLLHGVLQFVMALR
jgi:hypothetical protein